MIHLNVFCPVERVLSQLVDIGRKAGCQTVSAFFPDIPTGRKRFDVSTSAPTNFALGLSTTEREAVLRLDSWEGIVNFIFNDGTSTSRTVEVVQKLRTDAPALSYVERTINGVKNKLINGELADGTKVCYPEALDTVYPTNYIVYDTMGKSLVGAGTRPFYNYVLFSKAEDRIVIYGPAVGDIVHKVGSIKIGSKTYNLLENGEGIVQPSTPLNTIASKPTNTNRVITYLHLGDQVEEFVFGQINNFLDGVPLPGYDLLKILKVISFIELQQVRGNGSFKTDMIDYRSDSHELHLHYKKVDRGYTPIDDKFDKFYSMFVEANDEIKHIFERFDATSNSFDI